MTINQQLAGETNHGENVSVPIDSKNNYNIVVNVEERKAILNVDQNTENMTVGTGERFIERGNNVIFPKIGFVFHKSFVNRFRGKCVINSKRIMKHQYTHSEKDEIVHYLKSKGIVKN